jgi:DNA-binding CsgD family transcriptional regulator
MMDAAKIPAAPDAAIPAQPPVSARARWALLSDRQREVCTRIALGESREEICTALGFATKTFDSHRRAALARLGARGAADVVRIAVAARVIRVEVEPLEDAVAASEAAAEAKPEPKKGR